MRNFGLLLLVALLAGCQSGGRGSPISEGIDHHLHSRSQSTRIKMVILHYTAENNARSLQILTQGEVSAHYLITAPAPENPSKPISWFRKTVRPGMLEAVAGRGRPI